MPETPDTWVGFETGNQAPLPQLPRHTFLFHPPQEKPEFSLRRSYFEGLWMHLRTQAQKITEYLTKNRRIG